MIRIPIETRARRSEKNACGTSTDVTTAAHTHTRMGIIGTSASEPESPIESSALSMERVQR